VESLAERLALLPDDQQEIYKENPKLLVGAEAIAIGFLARKYNGKDPCKRRRAVHSNVACQICMNLKLQGPSTP